MLRPTYLEQAASLESVLSAPLAWATSTDAPAPALYDPARPCGEASDDDYPRWLVDRTEEGDL